MKKYFIAVTILALVMVLAVGCAGAPSPTPSLPAGMGMIEVRVTDPPPPDMEHIWVEIENLEVHKAGGQWTTIAVSADPFDLKAIEEIEEFLASQVVEAGRYTQLRLDVKTVTVVEVGEVEHDAKVPSGKIKLVGTFEVVENNTTFITLDFDGKKSVLVTGGGNYIFKPVIKLLVSGATVVLVSGALVPLEITITSLPDGVVGEEYEAEVEATGGTGSYTWSISEGDLPDGLTLDSGTGIIEGNPTTEWDYTFTVQVEDDSAQTDTQEFSISITAAAELEITPTSLPNGVVGEEYEAEVEATGGTGSYTWSISEGDLPDGLELDPDDGEISGTPEAGSEGDYTFTVQVEDDSAQTDTQEFSITIVAP